MSTTGARKPFRAYEYHEDLYLLEEPVLYIVFSVENLFLLLSDLTGALIRCVSRLILVSFTHHSEEASASSKG